MTNKEILENAIAKAIDGGWKEPHGNTLRVDEEGKLFCFLKQGSHETSIRVYGNQFNINALIFNHDFAKALWGEEVLYIYYDDAENDYPHMVGVLNYPYNEGAGMEYTVKSYLYHLQQMVIAEDPIKYLGENLNDA